MCLNLKIFHDILRMLFALIELVSKEMVFTLVLIWMSPSFKGRISTLFFHTSDVFSLCPVIT